MKTGSHQFENTHAEIQAWLPWFVRGELADDEAAACRAHLEHCAECADALVAETALESQLAAAFATHADEQRSPEPGLARLLATVNARESAASAPAQSTPVLPLPGRTAETSPRGGFRRRSERRTDWQVAYRPGLAALFAVALISAALLHGYADRAPGSVAPENDAFHVLSSGAPKSAALASEFNVVFDEQLTAAQRTALLAGMNARLVSGPNAGGAWTARIDSDSPTELASTLTRLRQSPGIRLAEAAQPLSVPVPGASP